MIPCTGIRDGEGTHHSVDLRWDQPRIEGNEAGAHEHGHQFLLRAVLVQQNVRSVGQLHRGRNHVRLGEASSNLYMKSPVQASSLATFQTRNRQPSMLRLPTLDAVDVALYHPLLLLTILPTASPTHGRMHPALCASDTGHRATRAIIPLFSYPT